MRDLNYQLKHLGRNNRDGSFATQAKRAFLLSQIANQLHELGYRGMSARSLEPKHVQALVALLAGAGLEYWDHQESHGSDSLVGRQGQPPKCRGANQRLLRYR